MRGRDAAAWGLRVAGLALGVALVVRPSTDAGTTRTVAIAAIVRGDANGEPVIERNERHTSTGWVHPSCEGESLRIEPRPTGRYAPVVVVGMDGWLADHGYAAGIRSSQGGRVLVAFTKGGERVGCREVFGHPEANLHLLATVIR